MTAEEAIQALDAIDDDPETAHRDADIILLSFVPSEVREAYERTQTRSKGWWYA